MYRANRPFHPQRFYSFISSPWRNGRLLRSKGLFWLASKWTLAGSWSQAGSLMRHGLAGRWWRFVDREHWPTDPDLLKEIMQQWRPESGDCRQELVFIGQGLDADQLRQDLDSCLLSDAEMQLEPAYWAALGDPFGSWVVEAPEPA